MSDPTSVKTRIAELERTLEQLRQQTGAEGKSEPIVPPPLPKRARPVRGKSKDEASESIIPPPLPVAPDAPKSGTETGAANWFSRAGVAMVLMGLAWLFKLSIDHGWFTPGLRIAFGALLGAVFLFYGWKLREARPVLCQALIGGGQAVFYVTIYAAVRWYALVSDPAAFCLMVLVSAAGFWFSTRLNSMTLAFIGMIGGYATSFLLYSAEAHVSALVVYTLIILAGAMSIFWRRQWLAVPPVAGLGALLVLEIAYDRLESGDQAGKMALQAGFVCWWLLLWLGPCLKRLTWEVLDEKKNRNLEGLVSVLALAAPIITLGYTAAIWSISKHTEGSIAFGASVLYLIVWWKFYSMRNRMLALIHLMAGAVLFTIGIVLCLKGNAVFFAMVLQALVLHMVAQVTRSPWWEWIAHVFSAWVGGLLFYRYFESLDGPPGLTLTAFFNLLAVYVGFYIWHVRRQEMAGLFYWIASTILLLGWPAREFHEMKNGLAWITVFWALQGFALVFLGHRAGGSPTLRNTAYAVLALAVLKLILCDMAQVAEVWRVLLFLGIGGLFLLFSYLLPKFNAENGAGDDSLPPA
ncbi:MAG: DUF2339 domain-containing protein [Methylacidiphilales bacterium]|nr:DUF2339 domain-containing protein [Candidatus Methylacidiphilales bacterium]